LIRLGQNDDDGSLDHTSTLAVRTQPNQVTYIQLGSISTAGLATPGNYTLSTDWVQEPVGPGVTPATNFLISGNQGGPFTPTTMASHLGNFSFLPTSFAVEGLPAWATASPSSGTLAAAAGTDVSIDLKSDVAAGLSPGTYNATASFRNTATNTVFATRDLVLSIASPASSNNDNFVNAIEVPGSGDTRTTTGTNATATLEAGEPTPNVTGEEIPISGSMWYTFTAPSSESITVETVADIDSVLAVYTGSAVGGLTQVAADWGSKPTGSIVSFAAVAGIVYRVQVASLGGTTRGPFTLNVYPTSSSSTVSTASRH
jgi:hypothetical protein